MSSCARGRAAQIENQIDLDVKSLLELMKSDEELDNNTLIVFTSDNGPHENCRFSGDYNVNLFLSTGGLRGKKHDLYEGGIKG